MFSGFLMTRNHLGPRPGLRAEVTLEEEKGNAKERKDSAKAARDDGFSNLVALVKAVLTWPMNSLLNTLPMLLPMLSKVERKAKAKARVRKVSPKASAILARVKVRKVKVKVNLTQLLMLLNLR